jgi:hypothetical protein
MFLRMVATLALIPAFSPREKEKQLIAFDCANGSHESRANFLKTLRPTNP